MHVQWLDSLPSAKREKKLKETMGKLLLLLNHRICNKPSQHHMWRWLRRVHTGVTSIQMTIHPWQGGVWI